MSLQSLIDNPKELLELIADCLKPKDIEKKQFGEVFTPMKLVNEMLDKLPAYVWTNKKLRWFDPAAGMGNFPIAVYLRLMETLIPVIKDDKERKKHIIENMLFMCELNKKNVLICKQIFNVTGEYKCRIYEGNSLDMEYRLKFDIIMGNPPYQDANASGDNKLYLSFIELSIKHLKDNGLLLFITPTNVKNHLTYQTKHRNYIDNFYNIKFLSINVANTYFKNVGSYFAYFLIEKRIVTESTTRIEFIRNKNIETDIVQLRQGYNLQLCMSTNDINIINKVSNLIHDINPLFDIQKAEYDSDNKITYQRIRKEHIISEKISTKPSDTFKFKIIDKINKSHPYPGIFYYSKTKMINYGLPKIIMCTGGYLMPEYDNNGEYNLSDNMIYLLCDTVKEFEAFKILINSKLVNYLNKVSMTDNIHGRDTVIMNMTHMDLSKITCDNDIYKSYGITNDEQKTINLTLGIE
ncbi:MAG: restriction-modification methylase [Gaeavirus sp.]|uniref:site-specific DNA-methyltransferase (adenine-specific) n=1 Tax=Gaeavirus sp. TaxID=2487767 RepID=A0A3G4ZYN2_9VIRU|nr:MAG: restriction-modification methylase [Gaeavirus sp.]